MGRDDKEAVARNLANLQCRHQGTAHSSLKRNLGSHAVVTSELAT